MSKQKHKPELTMETFFRALREDHLKELESLSLDSEHSVSYARIVRIAREEVEPTRNETLHLVECPQCQQLAARARAKMPEIGTRHGKGIFDVLKASIIVEPAFLSAGSTEPTLSELPPGVYRFAVSDKVVRRQRATVEIWPAGKTVRLRQVAGDPLLVKSTDSLLSKDFKEIEAGADRTPSVFLSEVLLFAGTEDEKQ